MKLLGAIGILFCIQLQRIFATKVNHLGNDDVGGFVEWAELEAYQFCQIGADQGDADGTMTDVCKRTCTDGKSATHVWDSMCDTLGKTITCANIPDIDDSDGNALFTAFTECCDACRPDRNTTCCAVDCRPETFSFSFPPLPCGSRSPPSLL